MSYPSYIKTDAQREAVDHLRELLPPGTVVHTILRHVSRSGMSRRISAVVIESNGSTSSLDGLIARTGLFKGPRSWSDPEGLRVGGAGMDMGFHLVYSLSRMLYPKGYACNGSDGYTLSGKKSKLPRCSSNDHFNGAPYRRGRHHDDGGYALRQAWL